MSQSKRQSLLETTADIIVGCALNLALNWVLLPAVLHIPHPSAHQNLILTAIFTVVAFARRYVMRRLFNRWHGKSLVWLRVRD